MQLSYEDSIQIIEDCCLDIYQDDPEAYALLKVVIRDAFSRDDSDSVYIDDLIDVLSLSIGDIEFVQWQRRLLMKWV